MFSLSDCPLEEVVRFVRDLVSLRILLARLFGCKSSLDLGAHQLLHLARITMDRDGCGKAHKRTYRFPNESENRRCQRDSLGVCHGGIKEFQIPTKRFSDKRAVGSRTDDALSSFVNTYFLILGATAPVFVKSPHYLFHHAGNKITDLFCKIVQDENVMYSVISNVWLGSGVIKFQVVGGVGVHAEDIFRLVNNKLCL